MSFFFFLAEYGQGLHVAYAQDAGVGKVSAFPGGEGR
jgi:hypothetical protein